jgi:hypothetical protein
MRNYEKIVVNVIRYLKADRRGLFIYYSGIYVERTRKLAILNEVQIYRLKNTGACRIGGETASDMYSDLSFEVT